MPFAVDVGERIIAVSLANQIAGGEMLGELGVFAGERFDRHRRAQFGHADEIVLARHFKVQPAGIFEQRIGQRHRDYTVADFCAAQDRETGEPVVEGSVR